MSFKRILAVSFIGMLALGVLGCEQEGPAERTGEQVDETVEEAGEGIEEGGEQIRE